MINDFLPKYARIAYSDRMDFFYNLARKGLAILEVGPGHAPVFSRKKGYSTDYVDALSKEGLVAKYTSLNIDTSFIEHIDYVWSGQRLDHLIPHANHYFTIFASHVIEHIPDLISFLNSCENLLRIDGELALAVPDARRSFDFFRPVSSTGQILDAFHNRSTRHSTAAVFDFDANFCSYHGNSTWFDRDVTDNSFCTVNALVSAYASYLNALKTTEYVDIHGWVYTPSSFLLILNDLATLGLTKLQVVNFAVGDAHEFYVILRKREGAQRVPSAFNNLNRDVLLRAVVSEVSMRQTAVSQS